MQLKTILLVLSEQGPQNLNTVNYKNYIKGGRYNNRKTIKKRNNIYLRQINNKYNRYNKMLEINNDDTLTINDMYKQIIIPEIEQYRNKNINIKIFPQYIVNIYNFIKQGNNKDKFPKIKPPSKVAIEKAALDHAMENPDIIKLMKEGKGVLINTDTGKVEIIEEEKNLLLFKRTIRKKLGNVHSSSYYLFSVINMNGINYQFTNREAGDSKKVIDFVYKSIKSLKKNNK